MLHSKHTLVALFPAGLLATTSIPSLSLPAPFLSLSAISGVLCTARLSNVGQ